MDISLDTILLIGTLIGMVVVLSLQIGGIKDQQILEARFLAEMNGTLEDSVKMMTLMHERIEYIQSKLPRTNL